MAQRTLLQQEHAVSLNLAVVIILVLAGVTWGVLIFQHHLHLQRQQQSTPQLTYSIAP